MVSEKDESFQLLNKEGTYAFYHKNVMSEWLSLLVYMDLVSLNKTNQDG